jgi:hypothetical protein
MYNNFERINATDWSNSSTSDLFNLTNLNKHFYYVQYIKKFLVVGKLVGTLIIPPISLGQLPTFPSTTAPSE